MEDKKINGFTIKDYKQLGSITKDYNKAIITGNFKAQSKIAPQLKSLMAKFNDQIIDNLNLLEENERIRKE